MFAEDLLLYNIGHNAIIQYDWRKAPWSDGEAYKIFPAYPFLKLIINCVFIPLKPVLRKI